MKKRIEKGMAKIPVLTDDELRELGKIMFHKKDDELAEKRFWKKVYEKRNIEY